MQKTQIPGSRIGYLKVSSLDSPDIHKWSSETGLASQKWLADMREKYGEGSSWWKSHVLAEFPDESTSSLFRKEWLDLAAAATHVPSGPIRIAVDYAEGEGGDEAVILVRDDGGLYELESSNRWSPDRLADLVAGYAKQYRVDGSRISWDASGTGSSFGTDKLEPRGLTGCRKYKGSWGATTGAVGTNARSCAAWACARRLDPSREIVEEVPVMERTGPRVLWTDHKPQTRRIKQSQFAIPERFMARLRHELQTIRYEETANGKIHLESGEDFRSRLGRSPNTSDALFQSFYWSH